MHRIVETGSAQAGGQTSGEPAAVSARRAARSRSTRASRRPDISWAETDPPSSSSATSTIPIACTPRAAAWTWRPEVADRLMNLRHRPVLHGAPGVPSRCEELAARGVQAWEIVEVALEDEGGSVTATEMSRRREALVGLERTARRALTAAGSPEVWPPA